jgi:hypothetical protein
MASVPRRYPVEPLRLRLACSLAAPFRDSHFGGLAVGLGGAAAGAATSKDNPDARLRVQMLLVLTAAHCILVQLSVLSRPKRELLRLCYIDIDEVETLKQTLSYLLQLKLPSSPALTFEVPRRAGGAGAKVAKLLSERVTAAHAGALEHGGTLTAERVTVGPTESREGSSPRGGTEFVGSEVLQELERLAELSRQGRISAAEFDLLKARLLGTV